MTIYYKGLLILKDSIKLKKVKFSTIRTEDVSFSKFSKLSMSEKKYFLQLFNNLGYVNFDDLKVISITSGDDILKNILFKIMNPKFKPIRPIIYEKVLDIDGNEYAREIKTGYLFPILGNDDMEYIFSFSRIIDGWNIECFKGSFIGHFIERTNFALCNCYCFNEMVANYNEIEKYEDKKLSSHDLLKMKELFQMNVFDDSKIISHNNQNLSINTTNSTNLTKTNSNGFNQPTNSVSNNSLNSLQEIKNILSSLSDEDLALLRDISRNDLLNIDIHEYMQMTKEEKLELLDKQVNPRPKVCLKKKN